MIPDKIKEDFYNKYNYQRPDAEKNGWEAFWDNAVEWCKEHWQEIVTTVGIIVGAALAIAAVVMTGGAALVPLLSMLLTAAGVSASTALTVATIMSSVAVRGKVILQPHGKEFFTWYSKHLFTLHGKHFFT